MDSKRDRTLDSNMNRKAADEADSIEFWPTGEIRRLRVPLPFSLRYVNSYVIKEAEGITVIDPGLHTPEAEEVWESALAGWGAGFTDITRIVLTHYHPDHYGLAGWMQLRSTHAPVMLSAEGHQQAKLLWGEGHDVYIDEHVKLFLAHGMDPDLAAQMVPHMKGFAAQVSPQPQVTYLREGELLSMGGRTYRLLHTPGHAYGHLCLYDAEARVIFCGDQVLPQISPNVSYMPHSDPNPLDSYLSSLRELSELDVAMAYPGHRDPFAAFGKRVRELLAHHAERLAFVEAGLAAPASGFAVCRTMFGDGLTVHQMRFAMAETLAHLVYLRSTGRAVELERNGAKLWRAVQG
ncbi:MBL fold metallo-hydrolase [Paenibacillus gansuensis]|uniref:MBL fold metallo-hydrolase n=1 Tax=Paenibacillus gansuensis TaxID=306542 RepID=A0ABW5PCD1_9BACL